MQFDTIKIELKFTALCGRYGEAILVVVNAFCWPMLGNFIKTESHETSAWRNKRGRCREVSVREGSLFLQNFGSKFALVA